MISTCIILSHSQPSSYLNSLHGEACYWPVCSIFLCLYLHYYNTINEIIIFGCREDSACIVVAEIKYSVAEV